MQLSAASPVTRYVPAPAGAASDASAKIADLTALAAAQTNQKMATAAGAALGQATSDLAGALVDISA